MPKHNPDATVIIRHVIAKVRCAGCQRRFGVHDVEVLDRRENLWAMALKCRVCHAEGILLAVVSAAMARSLRTDLTPSDWQRFRHAPPLNEDDVIRFHEFIQAYPGDFSEIMDEPLPID